MTEHPTYPEPIDVNQLDPLSTTLTKEEQLAIYEECKNNPYYYFTKVLRIQDDTPEIQAILNTYIRKPS